MSVSKSLIVVTITFIMTLIVGDVYFADSSLMLFVDSSPIYSAIRVGLIILLVSLFFSRPPRSKLSRRLLLVVAAAVAMIPMYQVANYHMNIIDMLVFIEVAIIIGIEAVELRKIPVIDHPAPARRIKVNMA